MLLREILELRGRATALLQKNYISVADRQIIETIENMRLDGSAVTPGAIKSWQDYLTKMENKY